MKLTYADHKCLEKDHFSPSLALQTKGKPLRIICVGMRDARDGEYYHRTYGITLNLVIGCEITLHFHWKEIYLWWKFQRKVKLCG